MASPYTVARSKTATMAAGGTAEAVTITGPYRCIQVINWDSTLVFYCTIGFGGAPTTAVANADDTLPVLPLGVTTLYDRADEESATVDSNDDVTVSIISTSGTPKYTVVSF